MKRVALGLLLAVSLATSVSALGALGLLVALASPVTLDAKGSAKGSGAKASHAKVPKVPKAPRAAVPRDATGKIQRSEAAKHQFETQTGYPHGRPGYVVDHIRPLACGGLDAPSNMQWQTVDAAKAKDGVERRGC
jgi:hypothetical protein